MYRLAKLNGHTFLESALPAEPTVVDLGANHGNFARAMADQYNAKVIAVEPTLELIEKYPVHQRVRVLNAAIAGQDAPLTFFVSSNSELSSTHLGTAGAGSRAVTVAGRSLGSICQEMGAGQIHLLKMDIEGAEKPLFETITDEQLNQIDQITVEFHDFTGAISTTDIDWAVNRLTKAGFKGVRFSHTHMDWLFYHPGRCRVGAISGWWMKNVQRHARFAWRNTAGRLLPATE